MRLREGSRLDDLIPSKNSLVVGPHHVNDVLSNPVDVERITELRNPKIDDVLRSKEQKLEDGEG